MSAIKRHWEQRTLELFGELSEETLEKARPIVDAEIKGIIPQVGAMITDWEYEKILRDIKDIGNFKLEAEHIERSIDDMIERRHQGPNVN